ncbi:MAG TPA: DUF6062 family protein [Chloroflexota bacterium]
MSSRAPRDTSAFEVAAALREPGCAVCRTALRSVERLIRSIAYEQVNDPALRARLRHVGGFCNRHAHQWLREASNVLGTALIYRDVLRTALAELESGSTASAQRGGLLRSLLGSAAGSSMADDTCPACQTQLEAEARYLEALLDVLNSDEEGRAALAASSGLCRRHTLAARRTGTPGAARVLQQTRRTLTDLLSDLDEVIRKEDYRFRHEPRSEAERTAPSRAIAWAAGFDGLVDA